MTRYAQSIAPPIELYITNNTYLGCMKLTSTLVLILVALNSYCQTYDVDHLTSSRTVNSIDIINDDVWAGTSLGMYKINKNDLTYERIEKLFLNQNPETCFSTDIRKDVFGRLFVKSSNQIFQYINDDLIKIEDDIYSESFDFDEKGALWIVSQNYNGDLIKWDNGTRKAYKIPYNLGIRSIYASGSTVYLGTQRDGILQFKNGNFSFINSNNSELPEDAVGAFCSGGNSSLAVYCYNADYNDTLNPKRTVGLIKDGNWTSINASSIFSFEALYNDLYSFDETLYAATNEGLGVYQNDSWELITPASHAILSTSIKSVARDGDDLWIGTSRGLSLIRNGVTTNIEFSREVPKSGAYDIEKDNNGNLWMAGYGGGLYVQNGNDWGAIEYDSSSIPSKYIAIDDNNITWTTYPNINYVYRIENQIASKIEILNNDSTEYIRNLVTDLSGDLWIQKDDKLHRYSNSVWTTYDANNQSLLGEINSIATDNFGNVWAACGDQGLLRFDGTNWTNFGPSTFSENYAIIYSIFVDEAGMFWMELNNYTDRKIIQFDPSSLNYSVEFDGLPIRLYGLLYVENDGTFWYDSKEGFSRYDGNNVTTFGRENGFLRDNFTNMVIDDSQNIWLSSGSCYITRFDENNFYNYVPSQPEVLEHSVLYPNPTEGWIIIKPSLNFTAPINIDVYDLNGKPLLSMVANESGEITVNLGALNNGLYIVNLSNEDHSEIHRVVKN